MRLQFEGAGGPVTLDVEQQDGALSVLLPNGNREILRCERVPGDIILLELEDKIIRLPFAQTNDGIEFSYGGSVYSFTPFTPTRSKFKRQHSSGELRAPMVGTVTSVLVENGESVKSYQPILVIEAMKVLATLEAPFAGSVELKVSKGQQVQHGQILADVIPIDEAAITANT